MATGRNALHIVLQESNLLEYEPLLLEEGTGRDHWRRREDEWAGDSLQRMFGDLHVHVAMAVLVLAGVAVLFGWV